MIACSVHWRRPTKPPGTATEVVEEGYTLRDRLLRPARVVVSKDSGKKSEKSSPSTPEAEDNELGSQWRARRIDP